MWLDKNNHMKLAEDPTTGKKLEDLKNQSVEHFSFFFKWNFMYV